LYDLTRNREVFTWSGKEGGVLDVAYSPDGRWLAARGVEVVRIWDAAGKEVHALRVPHPTIVGIRGSLAFSPDGGRLAVSGIVTDSNQQRRVVLHVFEVATGERVFAMERAWSGVDGIGTPVAYSPDGKWLALGGQRTLLWEAATGRPGPALRGNETSAQRLSFFADGARLVTAGLQSVRVWDVELGQQVLAPEGRGETFEFAGDRLFVFGPGETVREFDLRPRLELLPAPKEAAQP
jgi:WD40 repeat protein